MFKWFKKKVPEAEIVVPHKYKLTVRNSETNRNEVHNIIAWKANFFMEHNGVICHEFWDNSGALIRVLREASWFEVIHIEITR